MAVSGMKRTWPLLALFLSVAGCASLVDKHYEHSQHLRTEMAYLKFWWHCEEACGSDYKCGWKAGYLDVITGGDGQPPMFAPHSYWSPSQILCHCDEKRHEWYNGFQDGAMMASLLPDTHYLKVWAPPPTCQPGYYAPATESSSSTSEPALAPPSDVDGLMPRSESGDEIPMPEPPGALPALPGGSQLPPVPEKPMPAL